MLSQIFLLILKVIYQEYWSKILLPAGLRFCSKRCAACAQNVPTALIIIQKREQLEIDRINILEYQTKSSALPSGNPIRILEEFCFHLLVMQEFLPKFGSILSSWLTALLSRIPVRIVLKNFRCHLFLEQEFLQNLIALMSTFLFS